MDSGDERLLHLEDDCVFRDLTHLTVALGELPPDWDIVYLGANVVDEHPKRHGNYTFRIRGAWTTHCIGYSRKVVPFLIENQPDSSERMYDNWLSDQLPNLKAYIVTPMVAWQRPHFSKIWQQEVNYDQIFQQSQERIR